LFHNRNFFKKLQNLREACCDVIVDNESLQLAMVSAITKPPEEETSLHPAVQMCDSRVLYPES